MPPLRTIVTGLNTGKKKKKKAKSGHSFLPPNRILEIGWDTPHSDKKPENFLLYMLLLNDKWEKY